MDYQDALRKAGWPTEVLMIDFESFFTDKKHGNYSIKVLGTVEFVNDPRWGTLCLGVKRMLGPERPTNSQCIVGPDVKDYLAHMQELHGENLEGVTVSCLNGKFDILVLKENYGIDCKYVVDVLDLLRWYDPKMEHDLKHVAPYFGLPPKGDTKAFTNLSLADLVEQDKLKDLVKYCKNDVELQCGLLEILLPMLDWPEVELDIAKITLDMFVNPKFVLNLELADEIIHDMKTILEDALHGYTPEVLNSDIKTAHALLDVLPEGESLPTKPGKPSKNLAPLTGEGRGLALAKTDDACKEMLEHPVEAVRNIVEARLANNSWPNHIKKIKRMRRSALLSGGYVRMPLKSFGAHTHRWSGDEGVNPQNFGSRGADLITKMRHMMCSDLAADEIVLIADSAQIEARNLAWAAGQKDLVEIFRQGGDPYSDFATALFGYQVFKWKEGMVEEYAGQKKAVKVGRDFGKMGILAGGYGMGGSTMHSRCLGEPDLRPLYDDGTYDEAHSFKIVDTYRGKYKMIPKFWDRVQKTFKVVTLFPKLGTRFVHVPGTKQAFKFWNDGKSTFIRLPSGQTLRYRYAKVSAKGRIKYKPGRHWEDLYGGKITENIIQSMSRDFLAYWMWRMHREHNMRCILTVHDELIFIVKWYEAVEKRVILETVMTDPISWADGMPFGVESQVVEHYTK